MPPRAELMRQDIVMLADEMPLELERTGRTLMVVRKDYETRDRRYDHGDIEAMFATVAGVRCVEREDASRIATSALGYGGCRF